MKRPILVLLAAGSQLPAGEPVATPAPPPAAAQWITPTIDIRARYEFADVDRLDVSHALTVRERLGLKTAAWNGFSALVEGEFSQAIIDDYSGGAPGADPFVPGNSVIGDPETYELNQGYLQYSGFDTTAKLGRQRIIYDNAAFIGNVGFRQNEQTFDAISLANKSIDGLTVNYAFIDRVNRIFGSEADGIFQDIDSDIHALNVSYAGIKGLTLGGYIYLMDFEESQGFDNNTFGISAKGEVAGVKLYGEVAHQEDAGPLNDEEALYFHGTATKSLGKNEFTLGLEHLDAGFQTPLATLHLFNGFADAFIGQRAAGTHGGISDLYFSHTVPIFYGIKWINVLHAYGDNAISTDLGWEWNSVLVKKFNDHFSSTAKFAHFETEGALPTTTRFTLQLDYTF